MLAVDSRRKKGNEESGGGGCGGDNDDGHDDCILRIFVLVLGISSPHIQPHI